MTLALSHQSAVAGTNEFGPAAATLEKFLARHRVSAATLAIGRDGTVLLQKAWGTLDREGRTPLTPDARMRIASVSKVFTMTAVRQLIREGRIAESTRVFEYLGRDIAQVPGADPRLARITVGHLLRHEGGWDRERTFDPMFIDARVQSARGLNRPPTLADIVEFMLTQPLQFDPGSRSAYSNFGFNLLGLVVEKAAGQSYTQYVQRQFLLPLGLLSTSPGSAKPQPGEVWYDDASASRLNLSTQMASGGWIASAPELCRFLGRWWINGMPRNSARGQRWIFFGSLPGTTAMVLQRADGIDVAVLLNRRAADYRAFNEELRRELEQAIDGLKR